ncbi:MAG: hypothetical protein H0V97_03910 [Actinobacteria bacterium]|nr:hypothetical protein [Actinomycetota bacterium]
MSHRPDELSVSASLHVAMRGYGDCSAVIVLRVVALGRLVRLLILGLFLFAVFAVFAVFDSFIGLIGVVGRFLSGLMIGADELDLLRGRRGCALNGARHRVGKSDRDGREYCSQKDHFELATHDFTSRHVLPTPGGTIPRHSSYRQMRHFGLTVQVQGSRLTR